MAATQPPVGIDLGTTYSVVAYLDATGRPTTILNGDGDLLTPSAVAFEEGSVIVGKEAVRAACLEPLVFADCFKRDIGRPVFHRNLGGQQVPPEVLSAFLLERLKQDAERRLGVDVRQVVITVPAFFDETRRRATQEATWRAWKCSTLSMSRPRPRWPTDFSARSVTAEPWPRQDHHSACWCTTSAEAPST